LLGLGQHLRVAHQALDELATLPAVQVVGVVQGLGEGGCPRPAAHLAGLRVGQLVAAVPVELRLVPVREPGRQRVPVELSYPNLGPGRVQARHRGVLLFLRVEVPLLPVVVTAQALGATRLLAAFLRANVPRASLEPFALTETLPVVGAHVRSGHLIASDDDALLHLHRRAPMRELASLMLISSDNRPLVMCSLSGMPSVRAKRSCASEGGWLVRCQLWLRW